MAVDELVKASGRELRGKVGLAFVLGVTVARPGSKFLFSLFHLPWLALLPYRQPLCHILHRWFLFYARPSLSCDF